jgi:hypothetical protein
VADKDGNAIDITGSTVFFTAKINKSDADNLAVIQARRMHPFAAIGRSSSRPAKSPA